MFEDLKKTVCEANLELAARGVVIYTWGNASGITDDRRSMVIKPSGVPYELMSPDDMVVVDVETGTVVEGDWRPSSDTPTHLELYRRFDGIGGVVHTHSANAVAFAQAGIDVPVLGTTHADYFYGNIPCTRSLTMQEVEKAYEANTGRVIAETFKIRGIDPVDVPGVLVNNHGPFTWGVNAAEAVHNAVVLDKVAEMALKTISLKPDSRLPQYVLDKHYKRKHGPNAYYGQSR